MESDRYARHTLVPGWDQARLAQARVVIIGVGALGNEVGRILALSGVGHLLLCDPDRIETSNLSRCALFRNREVGQLKAEVAAHALRELAPQIRVEARPHPLTRGVGLAELRDADLVLGCLDSRHARLQLAGRCNLIRAPLIDGGTHPWGGEVRPYLDPDGPCFGCGLGAAGRAVSDNPWSCTTPLPAAAEGATAAASVLVGGWMALYALRYLMGLKVEPGILRIDGPPGRTHWIDLARDPDCPLHSVIEETRPLPLSHRDHLGALLAQLPAGATPVAWEEIERGRECARCGHSEEIWRPAGTGPDTCPRCGDRFWPLTTLELDAAPAELELATLGIPPREILAIRLADAWEWVELGAPGVHPQDRTVGGLQSAGDAPG